MNSILLLLALPAFAAAPPSYDGAALSGELKACAQAQIGAVNAYMGIPVEVPRVPALKAAADAVADAGRSCGASAQRAAVALREPADFVDAATKGPDAVRSRAESAVAKRSAWASRLTAAGAGLADLQAKADKEQDKEKAKKLKDAAEALKAALNRAGSDLADFDAVSDELVQAREQVERKAASARDARKAYDPLAAEVSRLAGGLPDPAAALKTRLDALGTPPENESRGRVYAAVDPLLDPARTLYARANSAAGDAAEFGDAYRVFGTSLKRFEDELKTLGDKKDALERDLSAAERLAADGAALAK